MAMQAVILAGGLGTRLYPLTKLIPKPMVPVAGAPYLEHQLRMLARQSINDIVLLTGYHGNQIEDYFGDGASHGLSIRYAREETPLGTGGALREAAQLLADTFLIIYGDSYLPIDYSVVLRKVKDSANCGVLVAYNNSEDTTVSNNLAVDVEGFVTRYEKGTRDRGLTHVEAGVSAFRRRVLNYIPPTGVVSFEENVYPRLIAERQLIALPTAQRFYDIGTPERLKVIERFFAHDHHSHTVSH